MPRSFAVWLLAGAACLSVSCASAPPEEPTSGTPRAVLLITVDGLIPGELSLFGGPEPVPTLETLAGRGAAWDDAWTASPMTRPAVTTYLTGVAPDRHGVRDDLFTPFDGSAPTVAELLSAAGYATAAFPDSSYLGYSSGLLDGFDVVAEPPSLMLSAAGRIPVIRRLEEMTGDFEAWLDSVPPDRPYFAWVHTSVPMMSELWIWTTELLAPEEVAAEQVAALLEAQGPAVGAMDRAIGRILELVEARGDLGQTLVVVAGTQGSIVGAEEDLDLVGPGFSVSDEALRVPVVIAMPASAAPLVADGPVWSPDVPATIAEATGSKLGEQAEGLPLTSARPEDRLRFAWAWASRDQMGWRAERTAEAGGLKRIEGSVTGFVPDAEPTTPQARRLRGALDARADPPAPAVPIDQVRPILEAHGLTLTPVPSEGREFATPEMRRELSARLLAMREVRRRGRMGIAREMLDRLMKDDPGAPAPLLDAGQTAAIRGDAEAKRYLEQGLELYPTDPELLHWYGHALWLDSWQEARDVLRLVAPYKQGDPDVLYDLACLASLSEEIDSAESYLRQSIAAGFDNYGHMETDPDLRNLRENGRLSEVLAEYRK
jgi:hypothetical protein